jgi:hypothetical protein
VPYQKVQRFINKVAGAIHRALPGAKVTTGIHSMPYCTNIPMPGLSYDNAPFNYYTDQQLVTLLVQDTMGAVCAIVPQALTALAGSFPSETAQPRLPPHLCTSAPSKLLTAACPACCLSVPPLRTAALSSCVLPQVAAGGDPQGTLDFYSVHGYPLWDDAQRDRNFNMFVRPKSDFLVDKPIIVGEHWEQVGQRCGACGRGHVRQQLWL